jgi:enoyl-CoA hydratase/carnithine racemase
MATERLSIINSHVSTDIPNTLDSHTFIIKLNKPESANAFDYSLVRSTIKSLVKAKELKKPVLISGMSNKVFSSGGDLKFSTEKYFCMPENLSSLHEMFFRTYLIENSVSLWAGFVIGSGAGLACSCKVRVAFDCTKYSMPENSIGLFPDVGGSYFLTHYVDKDIGLFASLTGCVLTGTDCYIAGLCNYYIPDKHFNDVINESMCTDPDLVVKKYHREPNKSKVYVDLSQIFLHKTEIKECFNDSYSIEFIIYKLYLYNTLWTVSIANRLTSLCPLSLKVKAI